MKSPALPGDNYWNTDGLAFPTKENIMDPLEPLPKAENFDIIKVKAVRFSEVKSKTP